MTHKTHLTPMKHAMLCTSRRQEMIRTPRYLRTLRGQDECHKAERGKEKAYLCGLRDMRHVVLGEKLGQCGREKKGYVGRRVHISPISESSTTSVHCFLSQSRGTAAKDERRATPGIVVVRCFTRSGRRRNAATAPASECMHMMLLMRDGVPIVPAASIEFFSP